MKVLITGIGGFVAPYLADELRKSGHSVFGVDRTLSSSKNNFQADITDYNGIYDIVKKVSPDYVFHLAAISSVKAAEAFPDMTFNVNVNGTRNVFESIVNAGIDPVVLLTSTADIYGVPEKTPIEESHPVNPVSVYARSKLEQERLAIDYFKRKNLRIVISRSFTHTGPKQHESFVCSDFAKQIAEIEHGKEPVIRVGNLHVKRDFSDVRDVVRAYSLAVQKCRPGEIYNICSEKAYSIENVLNILLSFSKMKIEVIQEKEKMRKNDIPILLGSCSKFRKATGWKPEIPFEKTLRDILDYWRTSINAKN